MKKILYLLLCTTIYGCIEKDIIILNKHIEVTASIPTSSRTSYSSENGRTYVSWVEGDEIGLFSNDFVNLKYSALNSGTETTFVGNTLKANEGDTIYALYPYDESINEKFSNLKEILSGKLPLQKNLYQNSKPGIPRYDYMYAMGVVKNNRIDFQFKHIFALLKITVPVEMLDNENILKVTSTENISIVGNIALLDPIKGTISGEVGNTITCYLDEYSNKEEVTVTLGILPQPESTVLEISQSSSWDVLYVGGTPEGGMKAGCLYKINLNENKFASRKEKDLIALKAFYESTNGNDWYNSTNWFSDEPLSKWHGLNLKNIKESDYASCLNLSNNNLQGVLNEDFIYWMDNVADIYLDGNGLYGKIPKTILDHPRWKEIGWNVICQDPWFGGGFDYSEGVNLKTKDGSVPLFVEDKLTSVYEVLSQNELTYVFNAGAVDMIWGISDARVNKYLDYCNKGFGIVATVGVFWDVPYDDYASYVKVQQSMGLPKGILWAKEFGNANSGIYGDMYLFDKEGNLIHYWCANSGIPESWYNEQLDKILYERLGEPEEHPIYSSKYYTSTDYTRDGEVITMQTAKIGKGIDIVFIGDAYIDKDMDESGKYETHMRKSMEYFFNIEPYKSFRDRFNVYAVKVISPNAEFADGCEHRINNNDAICFEYAGKIQNIDLEKATIINVINNPNPFFVSGYTNMYETGASVAYIEEGGPSSIIVHEAGGHGFAKLLDEYIYGGYENAKVPDNELAVFNDWMKTNYHNKGWGMNVDITNNPESVIWSHFLKDERYKDEVGIYQGAWFYPYDLWRASENSVMNTDYSWFNAPSREAIYKRIMELSEGEGWKYDYEEFVKYDEINRNASRSVKNPSQQKKLKKHTPPTFIKGSWKDAIKGKGNVIVPLR